MSPYYDSAKPHHTREGFRNNYPHWERASFWAWQWERWRNGVPKPARETLRAQPPDLAFLNANHDEPSATWIGHATVLVQIGGKNILTDPHFSERASPFSFIGPKRFVAPGIDIEQLPHIDAVLISHDHYDHLDEPTLRRLNAQAGGPPKFFVPLGVKPWLADRGISNAINIEELDWWDSRQYEGLTIHFVPSQHWSGRWLTDRNRRLWGGFAVLHSSLRFLYTGDTGYSRDFADIGARFGYFDLAAIPIGAYEPRWFMRMQHVDPAEAVQIHQDVHARYSVGVHWGTFELTDESLDEPPVRLAAARRQQGVPDERFFLLQIGETRRLAALPH